MTDEIRQEMQHYKDLAIELEQKLIQKTKDRALATSYNEKSIGFELSSNNENEWDNRPDTIIPVFENAQHEPPSTELRISKYSGDTITILSGDTSSETEELIKSEIYRDSNDTTNSDPEDTTPPHSNRTSVISKSRIETDDDDSHYNVSQANPPKLLRSDSYTMDNPSPMLLKHLMDQGLDVDTARSITPAVIVNTSSPKSTVGIDVAKQNNDEKNTLNKKIVALTASKEKVWRHKLQVKQVKKPKTNKNEFTKKTTAKIISSIYKSKKSSTAIPSSAAGGKGCAGNSKEPTTNFAQVNKTTAAVTPIKSKPSSPSETLAMPSVITATIPSSANELKSVQNETHNQETIRKILKTKSPYESKTKLFGSTKPQPKGEDKIVDFLLKIEENHKNQMATLMEQQQAEQRKMQENFLRQQELLIRQITASCTTIIQTNSVPMKPSPLPNDSTPINENIHIDSNRINETSPASVPCSSIQLNRSNINKNIAALSQQYGGHDYDDQIESSLEIQQLQEHTHAMNISNQNQTKMLPKCLRQLFANELRAETVSCEDILKNAAATKINAYVRGYLVRRLFKTEDVQAVIKIIRDTLLFILDLQSEPSTPVNPTPADVKLKRTLLQQLNSACESLHAVFFDKTISQKMEIISTDRYLLQRKRSAAKAADNASIDSSKSINKLKKISLFSVNISGSKLNPTKVSSSQSTITSDRMLQSKLLPKRPKSTT